MTHTVYLSLGSNLGKREKNLETAVAALAPHVLLAQASGVYETPPWGFLDQPSFLNQAIQVETELSPGDLLSYLKGIELQMGRESTVRYGPRIIDLDILFFDDLIMDTPELIVPHPRMQGRAFVLVPLAEIAPDLLHPVEGRTIKELLARVDSTGIEVYSP